MLTGAIGIIALLIKIFDLGLIIAGTLIVIAIIAALVFAVKLISDDEKQSQMKGGVHGLLILSIALLIIVGALGIITYIVSMDLKSLLIGLGIVMGVVIILSGIMFLLAKFVEGEELKSAALAMLGISAVLAIVALVTYFLLIPIGEAWQPAAVGGIVTLGIIAVLGLIAWGLLKIYDNVEKEDGIKQILILMVGMTIILALVGLVTYFLLVPIGKVWGAAAAGSIVTLGIIAVLGLIAYGLITWIKGDEKSGRPPIEYSDMLKAAVLLVGMIGILTLISLVTIEYLIPIGNEGKAAITGALITEEILVVLAAVGIAASKLVKDVKWADMGKAGTILGAMITALGIVAELTNTLLIPAGKEWKAASAGAIIVEAILVSLFGIGMAITEIASKISKKDLVKGGIVLAALGGIFWILGETMEPFIELCIMTGKAGWGVVMKGAAILGSLLGAMGLIVTGVGAIIVATGGIGGIILAAGAAVIAGLGGVFLALGETMPPYIELCITAGAKEKEIKKGDKLLITLVNGMANLAKELGKQVGFLFNSPLEDGVILLKKMSPMIKALTNAIEGYINVAAKLNIDTNHKQNLQIMTTLVKGWSDLAIATGKLV